jgi:hypothetical protein
MCLRDNIGIWQRLQLKSDVGPSQEMRSSASAPRYMQAAWLKFSQEGEPDYTRLGISGGRI